MSCAYLFPQQYSLSLWLLLRFSLPAASRAFCDEPCSIFVIFLFVANGASWLSEVIDLGELRLTLVQCFSVLHPSLGLASPVMGPLVPFWVGLLRLCSVGCTRGAHGGCPAACISGTPSRVGPGWWLWPLSPANPASTGDKGQRGWGDAHAPPRAEPRAAKASVAVARRCPPPRPLLSWRGRACPVVMLSLSPTPISEPPPAPRAELTTADRPPRVTSGRNVHCKGSLAL